MRQAKNAALLFLLIASIGCSIFFAVVAQTPTQAPNLPAILVNGQPVPIGTRLGVAVIGTAAVVNIKQGTGVVLSVIPDPAINGSDIVVSANTAALATHPAVQSGAETFCPSSNGTTAYTCSFAGTQALQSYTLGMHVFLFPDVTCAAACTLQIDQNAYPKAAVSIKQKDGTTDPGGLLIAGQGQWIWYDGTVFRLEK
jgi:hypothetical protein